MTITEHFGPFNHTKQSQNTFDVKYDNKSSKIIAKPQEVTLNMVTPGGQISKFCPNFAPNVCVMTITHQFEPLNHTKQSQKHIWCKV